MLTSPPGHGMGNMRVRHAREWSDKFGSSCLYRCGFFLSFNLVFRNTPSNPMRAAWSDHVWSGVAGGRSKYVRRCDHHTNHPS